MTTTADWLTPAWARRAARDARRPLSGVPKRLEVAGELTRVKIGELALGEDFTLDLTAAHFAYAGRFTLSLPKGAPPRRVGIVGGTWTGELGRDVPRRIAYSEQGYDRPALIVDDKADLDPGSYYVLADQRMHNVGDGWRVNAHGFVIADGYLSSCRDDAIEDDTMAAGVVVDSLIEGAHMVLSCRRSTARPEHVPPGPVWLDRCLLGLGMQGYDWYGAKQDPPVRGSQVDGRCTGQLFKWQGGAPQLRLTECVLRVPWLSCNGRGPMRIPADTIASDTTLVWLGGGDYPGELVDGITVTDDDDVWREARTAWLAAHDEPDPLAPLPRSLGCDRGRAAGVSQHRAGTLA